MYKEDLQNTVNQCDLIDIYTYIYFKGLKSYKYMF